MAQNQTRPELRRKSSVPENVRTEDRDEAAEYIEKMWPAKLSEIAEESGYSVSHVHNTIDKYFERITDDGATTPVEDNGRSLDVGEAPVEIPDDIESVRERRAFLRGWAKGYLSGDGRS